MLRAREIAKRVEAYGEWRHRVALGVSALHEWLRQQDLADTQVDAEFRKLLERLRQDRLVVAFVAESACGKSELIDALFFADAGRRVLATRANRTAVCPTEFLGSATSPPSLRLLPIETRLKDAAVQAFRNFEDEWVTFPLDLADADRMGEVLAPLTQTKRVPVALARALGLADDDAAVSAGLGNGGEDDHAEVPCWRHAIVNFPNPLLLQGLVVLDIPGLDATGTEPEHSLGLLPGAHVVVVVLAADAGGTPADPDAWKRALAGDDAMPEAGPLVVLDGIDGLGEPAKPDGAVAAEIERRVEAAAARLGLSSAQVFAVSARAGLLARINGDDALLKRSRLPILEAALASKLVGVKHARVGASTAADVRALAVGVRASLDARRARIGEELAELRGLRDKNRDVVAHMIAQAKDEQETFERGLQRFNALRTVFAQQTSALFDVISLETLRANAGRTRRGIERSPFTSGVRRAMAEFFQSIRRDFEASERHSAEIQELMQAMHARFAAELGSEPFDPPLFSMLKYQKEIDRLERAYNTHFNTLWNMLTKAKFSLTRRFFETTASRVKHVYEIANRDVEGWLRIVMGPLETRLAETHERLKRRLDSVQRIRAASGELDARIAELERQQAALAAQVASLQGAVEAVEAVALRPEPSPAAAEA